LDEKIQPYKINSFEKKKLLIDKLLNLKIDQRTQQRVNDMIQDKECHKKESLQR